MTPLQEFVDKMPHGKANEFRKRVVDECHVTHSLFRLWKGGFHVLEKYHAPINKVSVDMFGEEIFKTETNKVC